MNKEEAASSIEFFDKALCSIAMGMCVQNANLHPVNYHAHVPSWCKLAVLMLQERNKAMGVEL